MRHFETDKKYFFLPVNTGYVENSLPNNRCIEFYAARSGHGLYCSIVGNVVIPNGFGSNDVCAVISDSGSWRNLADAIAEQGARPGIQLSTTWKNYKGIKQFVVSRRANIIANYKTVLENISHNEVVQIFDNLRRGIELSVRAGFSHIQIHAGHGYLFSLLIDEALSQHSEFGLNQLNSLAKELTSENIESSIRISVITGAPDIDKNRTNLIENIFRLPFSFFDVSAGYYNIDKRLIYPISGKQLRTRHDSNFVLANQFPDKQIILSGKSYVFSQTSIPNNLHIGICRDMIANPNFLLDPTIGCTNCMQCHYYSRGESQLSCGQWQPDKMS